MKEDCGCCDGIEIVTPLTECNPPGLSAIAYRAGTYATFYETMLARLSNLFLDVPSVAGTGTDRLYPLKGLTARDTTDPSIALLDAWAVVGDVLTFYQERIANEGYLPTAIERRSILELAKLVGYRMRPGVAASVYLAFTTAQGFAGTFPAGTRAQSIPGTGQMPQFFETSADLDVQDLWNAMKPRLTRPQLISPPTLGADVPGVTDANVIDTIYFDGVATNLKSGDSLILVSGGKPILRLIESIDVQSAEQRTEVVLAAYKSDTGDVAVQVMGEFLASIDKAKYLFPGNAIAKDVGDILNTFASRIIAALPPKSATLAKGAEPTVALTRGLGKLAFAQIRERQAIAGGRGFTRLSAWLDHVQKNLAVISNMTPQNFGRLYADSGRDTPTGQFGYASSQKISPLGNLVDLSRSLALPPSVQPRSAIALKRNVQALFAPQSDTTARMVKAFRPDYAAEKMYGAWDNISIFGDATEIFAVRARASLFANRDPGVTPVAGGPPITVPPTMMKTWGPYVSEYSPPTKVLLDAAYDQIALSSIVAIDRPLLDGNSNPTGERALSFHVVTGKQTAMMNAGDGFMGNITFLTLDPPWLDGQSAADIREIVNSNPALTDTVVYAQAEALAITEEPLDTDVAGDTISLDGVYDGLEAGRWMILTGNRTDVANVTDVAASELVMIGGVLQGAEAPLSVPFPSATPPLTQFSYVTAANDKGERLVVGTVANLTDLQKFLKSLDPPAVLGQQYSDQVELAPGYYANALVPTADEVAGKFPDFAGALVNPGTGLPFPNGTIPLDDGTTGQLSVSGYYAWRISSQKTHTILKLANSLAYTYDTASVSVYGNVAKATHGQTTGEVLGDGDAGKRFQTFAMRQSPLTYLSAPTAAGAQSTLKVTVNEIEWHETDDLTEEGPRDRTFITSTDDNSTTSVIFGDGTHGARVPTGTANVKATYRYGIGAVGNVAAGQISQMASHPLGAQGVINPLPSSGGADRDTADMGRRNAPLAVMALDRLVSVQDYADFSRTYAGIGKAAAAKLSDGHKSVVYVTIAGAGDIPIDVNSDLYANLLQSLYTYGDPYQPVQIGIRKVRLLVISVNVALLPDYQWEAVEPVIRAAMLAAFGFDARDLGQPAFLSEAVRVIQQIEGVSYCDPLIFDSVGEDVTAEELASLAKTLKTRWAVGAQPAMQDPAAADPSLRIKPAELVFLTPDIADTLVLTQIGA
jgi:hypothetical protein